MGLVTSYAHMARKLWHKHDKLPSDVIILLCYSQCVLTNDLRITIWSHMSFSIHLSGHTEVYYGWPFFTFRIFSMASRLGQPHALHLFVQCAHMSPWRLIKIHWAHEQGLYQCLPWRRRDLSVTWLSYGLSYKQEEPQTAMLSFTRIGVFFTPTNQFDITLGHTVHLIQYGRMPNKWQMSAMMGCVRIKGLPTRVCQCLQ